MVEYFRLKDSLPAYTAGQRTGDRLRQRRSLADFAKALQTGDYNAASGSLAQMGDVQGAMNVRRIPATDEADRLGNEYTQTRIEDVGIDNRRADRMFAANQAQRQYANARAEAEFRLKQAKANSTLGKLKMDLDAGYITKEQFDAAVEKATAQSQGLQMSVGPDGQVTVQQGGTPLDKTNDRRVEESQLDLQSQRKRLNNIKSSVNPDFLTYSGRARQALSATVAGFDPAWLGAERTKELQDFAGWRAQTVGNMNAYIKEITGAAVTESEAGRLQSAMPNENDDPVSFMAKLNSVMGQIESALDLYEQQRFGQRPNDGSGAPDLSGMSDADLEAIINGGQ